MNRSIITRATAIFALAPLALWLPGCTADASGGPPAGAEKTSTTSEALDPGYYYWVWGTPGNDGQELTLQPFATWTCALAGVSGEIAGHPPNYVGGGIYKGEVRSIAGVYMAPDGNWHLRTHAGIGTGVMGYAVCISTAQNRTEFNWQDNQTSLGVAATSNRQCFLKEIWANNGLWLTDNAAHPIATIKITRRANQTFDMNDSFVSEFPPVGFDMAGATAVCVDIPPSSQWAFSFNPPANVSQTTTLRDSFPSGAPVPLAGVGCFLTGIWGDFANPTSWTDGVYAVNNSNVSPDWQVTASNAHGGSFQCFGL
jgi:hypothetical protein